MPQRPACRRSPVHILLVWSRSIVRIPAQISRNSFESPAAQDEIVRFGLGHATVTAEKGKGGIKGELAKQAKQAKNNDPKQIAESIFPSTGAVSLRQYVCMLAPGRKLTPNQHICSSMKSRMSRANAVLGSRMTLPRR